MLIGLKERCLLRERCVPLPSVSAFFLLKAAVTEVNFAARNNDSASVPGDKKLLSFASVWSGLSSVWADLSSSELCFPLCHFGLSVVGIVTGALACDVF